MSSFRTSLSSISQRGQSSTWTTLLAGLVVGLLLGLFVGWVVWPVEWQGALISDLSPASRAEYLSAVADSYVVYSSETARQQARLRLGNLQGNLLDELQSAMDYYRSQPSQENEIRIYNLAQLANALGGQANPAMAQVVAPAAEVPVMVAPANGGAPVMVAPISDAQRTEANAAAAANAGSSTGWFSWLLTLLAGILFVGGGLFLLQKLRQGDGFASGGRTRVVGGASHVDDNSFDDEAGFDDEDFSSGGFDKEEFGTNSGSATSRVIQSPWLAGEDERYAPVAKPTARVDRTSPWKQSLDAPELGEEGAPDKQNWRGDPLDLPRPTTSQYPLATRNPLSLPPTEPEYDDDDLDDFYEEVEEDPAESLYRPPSSTPDTYPLARQQLEREDDPFDMHTDKIGDDDIISTDDEALPGDKNPLSFSLRAPSAPYTRHRGYEESASPRNEPPAKPSTSAPSVKAGSAPAVRYPTSKAVGSFDCVFYAGMGDYDESFHVADPGSDRYIGQCGMGVSTKNRILHKNPDEVIALEVWLFDKADGTNLTTQMRVLMSEFASDHFADVFSKERNGDARPFVPQSGVKFQLEGPNLVLNGQIVEVSYTREGIFQVVKVHMDVLKR